METVTVTRGEAKPVGWFTSFPLQEAAMTQEWICGVCGDPIEVGSLAPAWFSRDIGELSGAVLVAVHAHCAPAVAGVCDLETVQSQLVANEGQSYKAVQALEKVAPTPKPKPKPRMDDAINAVIGKRKPESGS